jgi:uncharacterized protein involved in exopolysaccharide biosynthesis
MHTTQEWQLDGVRARRELSGGDYIAILYSQRRLIGTIVFVFLALAVGARLVIPEQYEGVVVMVATPSDNGLQGGMSGALSGLSFLTGASSGGDQKAVAIATLQGRAFLEGFIRSQNLMPVLFANEWDKKNGKWKTPSAPTLESGYNKLASAITVDASPTESIVRLHVRWTDAQTASIIANDMVRKLNSQFQTKAIDEAQRIISSLTVSYPQTSIAEVRTSIANLIQEQIKQRILAQSRSEYAMTVIDPAEPSKKKLSPGLLILLPAGLFLGLFFGVPAAFLAHKLNFRWPRAIEPLPVLGA